MTNEQLAAALKDAWEVTSDGVVPIMNAHALALASVSGIHAEYFYTAGNIDVTPTLTAEDGTVLTEGTHYTKTLTYNGNSADSINTPGTYTYTFTAVDGGGYTGVKTFSFKVTLAAPADIAQTAYTDTTAALSWTQAGSATGWIFEYSTDKTFSENVTSINTTATSVTLTNLAAEGTVYARIKAVNGELTSTWSDTIGVYTTSKHWIGMGATAAYEYLPTYCFYKYSLTQQIYTASELGTADAITSIDFMNADNNTVQTRNIDIYMVHTDKNSFSSSADWISVTEADRVFSGPVEFGHDTWTTIKLDRNFIYNGTSNVALIIDDNSGSYKSGTNFRTFTANSSTSLYVYNDYTDFDPLSSPASYTVHLTNQKNAIRLKKETPYNITVDDNIQNGTVTLNTNVATEGEIITITGVAEDGYYFSGVTVNDGAVTTSRNADGTISFVMPAGNAAVVATFEASYDVTVTWKNYDGTVLLTEDVPILTVPSYTGETPTKPDDDIYSYSFDGWNKEMSAITEDTTYTAVYKKTPIRIFNTAAICNDTNKYNSLPYYSNCNTKTTGSEQIYPSSMLSELTGKKLWSMTFYSCDDYEIDVKGMQVYLAEVDFDSLPDKYANPENGVLNLHNIDGDRVQDTFTATNIHPVKVFDGDYNFGSGENVITFDTPYAYGGGNLLVIIQNTSPGTKNYNKCFYGTFGSISYSSRYKYSESDYTYSNSFLAKCSFGFVDENRYTVTWKNTDGNVLQTDENQLYGTVPEFKGTIPTQSEDEFYTYAYHWDKEITAVTGNVTYTLVCTPTPKQINGSVTVCEGTNQSANFPYDTDWNNSTTGSEQIYSSSMLSELTGKKLWSMTFYSCDDYVTDVKGMQVYLAEVDFDTLTDKYAIPENGVLNLHGTDNNCVQDTFTATNIHPVKVFDGDYDFSSGENVITFDTPYTYGGGNLLVIVQNTSSGTNSNNKYFYGTYSNTSDVSRHRYSTANYTYSGSFLAKCSFGFVNENKYTVIWKDIDGTVLETDTDVISGTMPSYDGENPAKPDYTFDGWSPEVAKVTSDVTYTAVYHPNTITVTWKNADDTVLATDTFDYGVQPTFSGNIQIPSGCSLFWSDGTELYTSDNIPAPDDHVIYKAVFVKPLKVGTVFYAGDTIYCDDLYCGEYGNNVDGIITIGPLMYQIGYYGVFDDHGDYLFAFQSEDFSTNVGIKVKGGTGESDNPFTFKIVLPDTKHTVTWCDSNGNVIETDEEVPFGSIPTFDGTLEVPEGTTLYRKDENDNLFNSNDVPTVSADVTYTAVFTSIAKLQIGTEFKEGDLVDFGSNYILYVEQFMPSPIKVSGVVSIDNITYDSDGYFVNFDDSANTLLFFVLSESDYGDGVSIVVTGGSGTKDDPFTFTAINRSKTYTITWLGIDGTTVLETDTNVPLGSKPVSGHPELLPADTHILWIDENGNTYSHTSLPKATANATYTAISSNAKTLQVGTVLRAGDVIDTNNVYINQYDGNGQINITIANGVYTIQSISYDDSYNQYEVRDSNNNYLMWVTSEEYDTDVSIKVVGGEGTSLKPFIFKVITETENSSKVIFEADGKYVADVYVPNGNTIDESTITNPVKSGYVFRGWLNGNTPFEFNTPVTTDMTLTADFVEAPNYISGANLTLNGDIDVNVYLQTVDTLDTDTAYVMVYGPNDPDGIRYDLKDMTPYDTYGYKISYLLNAQQMGESVIIHLFDGNGVEQTLYSTDLSTQYDTGYDYSPKKYFATVTNGDSYSDSLKNLVSAMENYGEYARIYFGSKTAQVCTPTQITDVTSETLAGYATIKEGDAPADVTYIGNSLLLKSKTSLRFYFDSEIANFTVTNNLGTSVDYTTGTVGGKFYVEISDISALNLSETFIISIGDYKIKASALTYAYNALRLYENVPEKADVCNVAKALYKYYVAAFENRPVI